MNIHFIAIGGTGMAPLACLLQEEGHRISGSDGPLYPPMSTLLERAGIEPLVGYDPAHLAPPPDLVVVGNAVHRDNPEALEAERRGLETVSMPQALARFFLADRRPLVIAGTHGKTTTSSMAALVLSECGADPGYLIGGAPLDLPSSFRRGGDDRFVIEGDEYNAAYFDRGPKFLHYRAETVVLTSAEYDHADLYPDPESFREAFVQLVRSLPGDGCLIACFDSPEVRDLAALAECPVVSYSADPSSGADVRPVAAVASDDGVARLQVAEGDLRWDLRLQVFGSHNVSNALAAWCAARRDGHSPTAVAEALSRFRGVRRRLEEIGEAGGVVVVDDFAHHPTEVEKSIEGLRARYPGRRVVVLYEPRSLTAGRSLHQQRYLEAFAQADRVLLAPVFWASRLDPEQRLDLDRLAAEVTARGTPTVACSSVDQVAVEALAAARPGDVVASMSSGSFEGLSRRLLAKLGERSPR